MRKLFTSIALCFFATPFTALAQSTVVTVTSGGSLVITSGAEVTVAGDITNEGSFIIESEASLLQTEQLDGNTGSGNYAVSRDYVAPDQLRFSYWSSPITNAQFETVFASTLASDRYRFNSTIQDWAAMPTGTLNPGQGYAATPTTQAVAQTFNFNDSRTFNGAVNNGDVSLTVNDVSAGDFILLGNPYPSAIDFTLFSAAHPDLIGTIYFWDASPPLAGQSAYANWNASGAIRHGNSAKAAPTPNVRSMQGFMVQVDPDGSIANANLTFTFTNAMRISANNTSNRFFKTETRERFWLSLSSENDANSLMIMLDDRATDDFDQSFDAPIFKGSQFHSFYSELANHELSIQALDYLAPNEEQIIPLGIDAFATGMYTIAIDSINNWQSGNNIILVDNLLEKEVDLNQTNYSFTVNKNGPIKGRFYLKMGNSKVIQSSSDGAKFFAFQNNNGQLVIVDQFIPSGLSQANLADFSGRMVKGSALNNLAKRHEMDVTGLSAGVYMLMVNDLNGKIYQQKIYLK